MLLLAENGQYGHVSYTTSTADTTQALPAHPAGNCLGPPHQRNYGTGKSKINSKKLLSGANTTRIGSEPKAYGL